MVVTMYSRIAVMAVFMSKKKSIAQNMHNGQLSWYDDDN